MHLFCFNWSCNKNSINLNYTFGILVSFSCDVPTDINGNLSHSKFNLNLDKLYLAIEGTKFGSVKGVYCIEYLTF